MTKKSLTSSSDLYELYAQSNMEAYAVITVARDYEASSVELLKASELIGNDDVRVEMIKHLHPEFEKIMARDQALGASVKAGYNRDWVLSEMKAIAVMNRDLARKIREKLEGL